MPLGGMLERVARAFLDMQRAKLGIPGEEQAAAASADTSALRRAQAAKALQDVELAPADQASQIEYRRTQGENLSENTAALKALREAQAKLALHKADAPTPQKQVERTVDFGNAIRTYYTDGTVTDEPKGAAPKAPGTGLSKTGVQIIRNGKPEMWFPPQTGGALPEGASFATDARSERKAAVAAVTPLTTVETLAGQVESALNTFDQTDGLVHPIDKAVANSTYKSQLQALAVPWGRLLGDSRISDQDRAAYQRSVGEPSFFMREVAPDVARQRLANLRSVIADIRQKYGDVLTESSGMLEGVGGGAHLLGGTKPAAAGGAAPVSPNVQRVLDLLSKRKNGAQ